MLRGQKAAEAFAAVADSPSCFAAALYLPLMPFPEYKSLDLPSVDREVLARWASAKTFQQSVEQRPVDQPWVFYEGPPSANGKPGIHHVMARTVKDLFCRYHTMLGQRVERKGGWDTHGLPVELKVEQELGITKDDIGKSISVAEYNERCRETVMRFKAEWDELTVKMGYWVDLDDPYVTFTNDYIESVWWLLGQLYHKGLLYKGYTIQPYSPAAGTGLSSHELNMPGAYKEVKDTTVVALFRLQVAAPAESAPVAPPAIVAAQQAGEAIFVSAWTTTPWTLPSNTGLTVGPRIAYVLVKTENPYTQELQHVVLAAELVSKWFGGKNQPQVLEQSAPFYGEALVGLRYEPIFDYGNAIEAIGEARDAYRIIAGDFVTTSDGTGIVHTAPSFGADDRRAGIAAGLGALTLVDQQGKFKDSVGPFSGRYVKDYRSEGDTYVDVNIDLAVDLKLRGQALNVAKYEHNYPHCWRTDKPVLYYPLDSWFIRASAAKERMAQLNQTINWKPASTGTGRFGNWLDNLQDWNLSRSRYWGIPLPIWRSACGTEELCISSVAQLSEAIKVANEQLSLKQAVPQDLHRPFIDEVVLWQNGKELRREADLIDVWFDSGAMPYAQWHYPFANKEVFARNYPADFIAEGVDQTRGWFYTLHAIATLVFDQVAYKNVVSNGLVLDKDGQKMSKRLGNAVDPFATIDKYGADAVRWYMMTNAAPWDNLKFDEEGIGEVTRKFFGTLSNTYGFFALYANVDGWRGAEASTSVRLSSDDKIPSAGATAAGSDQVGPPNATAEIDAWLRSRMNSLLRDVRAAYDAYEPMTAGRLIQDFVVDEFSNWWVRLNRKRFWRGQLSDDKRAAFAVLHEALSLVAQLMAPIAPFYAERLYSDLGFGESLTSGQDKSSNGRPQSVHLSMLPTVNEALIDTALEERMSYAQRISSLGFSLRKGAGIKVRQPLGKMLIPVLDDSFRQQLAGVEDLILQELNVKSIEYVSGEALFKTIKPNFRVLGKKVGKDMKAAAAAIAELDAEAIQQLESEGQLTININGELYTLEREDVEIAAQDIPGWSIASDGKLTVALDLTLTPELESEGLARELINRIQNLRKNGGLEVTDRIEVQVAPNERLATALAAHEAYVMSEVLADSLTFRAGTEGSAEDFGEGVGVVQVRVVRA